MTKEGGKREREIEKRVEREGEKNARSRTSQGHFHLRHPACDLSFLSAPLWHAYSRNIYHSSNTLFVSTSFPLSLQKFEYKSHWRHCNRHGRKFIVQRNFSWLSYSCIYLFISYFYIHSCGRFRITASNCKTSIIRIWINKNRISCQISPPILRRVILLNPISCSLFNNLCHQVTPKLTKAHLSICPIRIQLKNVLKDPFNIHIYGIIKKMWSLEWKQIYSIVHTACRHNRCSTVEYIVLELNIELHISY